MKGKEIFHKIAATPLTLKSLKEAPRVSVRRNVLLGGLNQPEALNSLLENGLPLLPELLRVREVKNKVTITMMTESVRRSPRDPRSATALKGRGHAQGIGTCGHCRDMV